jgi:ribosomal-protein-alanine N-acetyltransferase
VLFRQLALGDLGQVAEIEQQSVSPWTAAQIADELSCATGTARVAVDAEGRVLGWCCARYIGPEAELLKIAVSSDSRRSGIAGRLLLHLEKCLAELQVETIFLEVRSRNSAALHLYLKHNFIEVGVRTGYYSDPADNALIFRKELPYSGC